MQILDLSSPLFAGWLSVLLGVISGAIIGLFFHDEEWLGGYASYRRRLLRLGHISFFGLGFLSVLFGLTAERFAPSAQLTMSGLLLVAANALMPICCFLSAWRKPLRILFPLPVLSALGGVVMLLLDWRMR